MGALRKAGVWLGLVEEDDRGEDGLFDDEFAEDDDFAPPARPRPLAPPASRLPERRPDPRQERESRTERELLQLRELRQREAELRADRESRLDQRDVRQERDIRQERGVRGSDLPEPRLSEMRPPDRASVRQLPRPTVSSSPASFATQDNLALAPQVQLRERAVVTEERSRRHQITTLHPTSYSEARAIGEHFRDGHPVIMNLTEVDEPDAKRLVDFAAGLAFGLCGGMERVTNRVFLLSPPNMSAEDKARIAEGGFFDQE